MRGLLQGIKARIVFQENRIKFSASNKVSVPVNARGITMENLELPMKDVSLIGKRIYNTKTDKYGMITEISLQMILSKGGISYSFKAYYDKIEPNSIVFAEDLYNGNVRFVIIDIPGFEKYQDREAEEIKEFMGDKLCANTIMHISEEFHKKKYSEQEYRGILEIMGKANELDSLASDIIQDNYSMLKYFCLFTDGTITENQMLYGLVNVLSSELRNKRDEELKGIGKVMTKETETLLKETMKEWIDKNPQKYADIVKGFENGMKDNEN